MHTKNKIKRNKQDKANDKSLMDRYSLQKFGILLIIILIYFLFISLKFGVRDGFFISILTWTFFVLCTPIADAGFLLDFPIRLFTSIRMVYSEAAVWIFSIIINVIMLLTNPSIYSKTLPLQLFHHILTKAWPFWLIILLSLMGTFLSIFIADKIYDMTQMHKWQTAKLAYLVTALLVIIMLILALYDFMLNKFGITI